MGYHIRYSIASPRYEMLRVTHSGSQQQVIEANSENFMRKGSQQLFVIETNSKISMAMDNPQVNQLDEWAACKGTILLPIGLTAFRR